MSRITMVLAASVAVIAFMTGPRPLMVTPARAACDGERIDGTTSVDATRTLQAQGYQNAHDLKKGCDNFWYGYASKGGGEQHISVSPTGEIMLQHE